MSRRILFAALLLGGLSSCSNHAPPELPPMPGVDPITMPAERSQKLAAHLQDELAEGWQPRTRHLDDDGRPLFTNRLLESTCPYLRQHAHNPVNWFPWGEEAFALAKSTGRPIFLSIGYATCHWCHVMEEESFEDPEIAAMLNAHFIPIKVDRETRPDVDKLYMKAVTAMTGRGGWPATLVLQPDKQPFFGATYLPARDGDRGRSKGLLTLLEELSTAWETDRDRIVSISARLTKHIQRDAQGTHTAGIPGPELLDATVRATAQRFDIVHGGASGAPKFPSQIPIRALLIAASRGDEQARKMALDTLDAMQAGGLYDQVGGGFHRYTVDEAWRVPHFEKMLYDNAQLSRTYGEAFQLTGDLRYAQIVDETLEAMIRDLGVNGGGFASALDADSLNPEGEREEGWFYTWTPAEIDAVLGERSAPFQTMYGVTEKGEQEGRNVLYLPEMPTLEERQAFKKDRLALLLARRQRPAPLRDDKVLTGWNGLAIASLAYNGWLFQQRAWVDEARTAAKRLLDNRIDGRLVRVDGATGPEGSAFLDDYVFLIDGLITLFEATGEARWLEEARTLESVARTHYGAPEGPWFLTADEDEVLLTRERPTTDRAVPSPNTVMIQNLLRLAALTSDDAYRKRADAITKGLPIARSPLGFAEGVVALEARHQPLREIVLVLAEGERSSGLHAALRTLSPSRRVLVQQVEGAEPVIPLAANKVRLDAPTVYVCQGGLCERPLTDPAAVAKLLAE